MHMGNRSESHSRRGGTVPEASLVAAEKDGEKEGRHLFLEYSRALTPGSSGSASHEVERAAPRVLERH